ncbi:MAG: HAMP domain-containing histidine kinase [Sphingobacteriales bacterium]|nr:HAMP domain-containing histidine kinase [Sphingobacteriales bacterium]
MKPGKNFRKFFYQHGYLLIIAGWLLTISLFFNNYWSETSTLKNAQHLVQSDIQRKEQDIDKLLNDSVTIQSLITNRYSQKTLESITSKPYSVFIYSLPEFGDPKMLFWNTSLIEPSGNQLQKDSAVYYERMSNGDYVVVIKKLRYESGAYKFIALIPVRWNYFINTDYLQNNFVINTQLEKKFEITTKAYGLPVLSITAKPLFNINNRSFTPIPHLSWWAIVFRMAAIFFVLFFIQILCLWIVKNRGAYTGVMLFAGIVLLIRAISYFVPVPLNFRQFELFDPTIYSSSSLHRSLGDVLLNILLVLWVLFFAYNNIQKTRIPAIAQSKKGKWIAAGILGLSIVMVTFSRGNLVKSLVADSQISFNVTNFFSLNSYSYIGILVLCGIAISYYVVIKFLFRYLQMILHYRLQDVVLVMIVSGLIFLSFEGGNGGFFDIYLFIWMLMFLALLNFPVLSLNFRTLQSSVLLLWFFFFSASISSLLMVTNSYKEINERKRMAEKLSLQADPSSESLMSIGLANFNNFFLFENFDRLSNPLSAKKIKDSLLNENFSGYLNKYDTKFYTFDKSFHPLYNEDSVSFNSLNTILSVQGKPTSVPNLYYYETSFDKFSYICRKNITNPFNQEVVGYAYIVSKPRKYKSEALQPELFARSSTSFASIEKSPLYAFGIYTDLQLVSNYNDYPFPLNLTTSEIPKGEFEIRDNDSSEELWYKASADRLVIVVRKSNFMLEAITLFAWFFCAFLITVAVIQLFNIVIMSGLKWSRMKQFWELNIRSQVHSTIIFISLLSFIVIGFSTIQFFKDRYNRNNKEKLSRTIQIVASAVKNELDQHNTFDDVLKVYDNATNKELDDVFTKISEIHNVDVSLYDLEGNLKLASNKLVYNKGLLSQKMEPDAYYHLTKLKQIQHVQNEHIGSREFLSIYVPVRDERGSVYAYLNIPSFYSPEELNQEISNFLVTIINLNAFIFLVAGLIALLITNRITNSFSIISERMKALKLGRNEEIKWNRNDEIGDLVKEYNKMVKQLDESAQLLAKSEREGAWREMARQVAHEIKNPLTPMKLSIQYLQKAVDSNAPNVKEMTGNVANTLVEQIDHLSKIAGEFSQFANLGIVKNENFDINEVLGSIISLYRTQDGLTINWNRPESSQIIHADKTQINRLFTNLFQNAIQSVPETREPKIVVMQSLDENVLTIVVSDNGTGIPPEVQSKIFTPNFTTKTSGAGLGLAMCKGIVENVKGKIWFETTEDAGTSFYIQFPVA